MNAKPLVVALALVLAGCEKPHEGRWLGYAEGEAAYIAAPQAGWLTDMKIKRGDWVKTGDVLFVLDDTSQAASRDSAEAQIAQARSQRAEAEANLDLTRRQLVRQKELLQSAATSRQTYDQAKSAYDAAAAKIETLNAAESQAKATLAGASYQLAQRQVVALTTGRVQDVYFRQGEYASAMAAVVSVLPPDNVYVRFFVPEAEFASIKLGRKVKIHCDGCGDGQIATIAFIAAKEEYTPPVIYSNQSRGQMVFKVEARAEGGLKLNPGQPVDVDPL
jgi:HlyD family secretion protein